MIYPQQPGTYCFHNTVNNKVYVGSAKYLNNRIKDHLSGRDSNQLLQQAIKKYGLKAFNIAYATTETHAEAKMQEQLMLDYLFGNSIPKYNLSASSYGGGSFNAKIRYALEITDPEIIHTFQSSCEAAYFTEVPPGKIQHSCKNAKLCNGSGRWLFSGVSKEDLICKFNNLTPAEIKGSDNSRDKTRGFILINKITQVPSQIFNSVLGPQKLGYKIHQSSLSDCLLGNRRTANGYYVTLII